MSTDSQGVCGEEDVYTGVYCNKPEGHAECHKYVDPDGSLEVRWNQAIDNLYVKNRPKEKRRLENLYAGTQYTEALNAWESFGNNII